jgi:hypothetical protein
VGESKQFDPEDYRRQALSNAVSKAEASRRAYTGAGAAPACHGRHHVLVAERA